MANVSEHGEIRVGPEDWEAHRALPNKPQIVVGGPGTGKTQFLCDRVSTAIRTGTVDAAEVIMLTFSRRGANDIRTRLFDSLGAESYRLNVSTYHSLAMRIVESHATSIGWSAAPSVLAGSEQEQFILDLLADEDPANWHAAYRGILHSRVMAAEVTDFILRCHEHLLKSGDVAERERDQWRGIPEFFERYLLAQTEARRTDYGRILADAVHAVETLPEVAAPYRLVIADEYQDTSPAQARLLVGLAANTLNLVVAADPYQSIYSFRGTDIHNVFTFPQDTEVALGTRAERIVLTTSFRVPAEILTRAVAVTARELPGGAGKVLSTRTGGTVQAHTFPLDTEEAEWIAADIEHLHLADGVPLERVAVFLRADSPFTDELSRALDRRDIPHTYEESRLADQPIVRFVRDLVTAATSEHEADEAVRRVLLSPYIGVPPGSIIGMDARRAAGEEWDSIVEAAVPNGGPLAALLSDPTWATGTAAPNGLWRLWSTLPWLTTVATDDAFASDRRAWSAFAQALERLDERAPNATLVDHERLVGPSDFEADPLFEFRVSEERGVTVTTLHRSKGTSFDVVYIAQANEGTFPDLRTTDSLLGSRHLNPHLPPDAAAYRGFRLDEERRLAYTAMTRASAKVVWTATADTEAGGTRPSRFLPLVASPTESNRETVPLTHRSFEAMLRRTLGDPEALDTDRLAAASILAGGSGHGLGEPLARYGTNQHGPDGDIIPKELRMSPSQATSYLICPRRYAVERYLMTQSDETEYMRFGSLIHKVLEEVEREASHSGREHANAQDATAWLERIWDEYGFGDDAVGEAWRRKAVTMLDDIYRLWPSSRLPVGFETGLQLTVNGTSWFGKADRIEANGAGIVVVDYKTGAPVTQAEAAVSIQLGYYAMAASEDPDVTRHGEVVGAEFWYPKVTNRNSIGTRSFDMTNLDLVKEQMIDVTNAIHAEQFSPTPGPQCDSCAIEIVCPARPAGREAFA